MVPEDLRIEPARSPTKQAGGHCARLDDVKARQNFHCAWAALDLRLKMLGGMPWGRALVEFCSLVTIRKFLRSPTALFWLGLTQDALPNSPDGLLSQRGGMGISCPLQLHTPLASCSHRARGFLLSESTCSATLTVTRHCAVAKHERTSQVTAMPTRELFSPDVAKEGTRAGPAPKRLKRLDHPRPKVVHSCSL